MRKMLAIAALSLVTTQSFAAEVLSAKLDASKKNIVIDANLIGGCKEHNFTLRLEGCSRTAPVSCQAQLVDNTFDDTCEAEIATTVVINLKKAGLAERIFSRGSLTILGSKNSKVSVKLP